jgi:hypothetical protein
LLLCGGWRWRLSLDGVADRLKLADEFACSPVRVLTADEVVHAKIMVGLISLEHVEDRHQDAVLKRKQLDHAGSCCCYAAAVNLTV